MNSRSHRGPADSGRAPQSALPQQPALASLSLDKGVESEEMEFYAMKSRRGGGVAQKICDFAHKIFFVVVIISNVKALLPALLFTVWTP